AVTPVRAGPRPGTSGPAPRTIVAWPTRTPATSVIALCGPGVMAPRATPASRARGRRPACSRTILGGCLLPPAIVAEDVYVHKGVRAHSRAFRPALALRWTAHVDTGVRARSRVFRSVPPTNAEAAAPVPGIQSA